MDEENTINTLLNANIPESVDEAFQNLTSGLTKNVGNTLADIWYMVFGKISYWTEKRKLKFAHSLEQFQQELNASISAIPPEKLEEPTLQVTAQALENAKYCITEAELREMFTSLISNSMNSDFSEYVRPSFAEIIKQMSPLDAKILKKFKSAPLPGIPICNYLVLTPGKPGQTTIMENVFLGLPDINLDACSTSISSLERFGLIQIPTTQYLLPAERYDVFKQHPTFRLFQQQYPNKEFSVEKKLAKLTPLGILFTKVCVPD